MHATVCLLCSGQLDSVGHAAKLGRFKSQFLWVKYDPTDVKGLIVYTQHLQVANMQTRGRINSAAFHNLFAFLFPILLNPFLKVLPLSTLWID